MAASADVTVVKDGTHGNARLHPYLVTLVRWCISCVWGTATVFLHRLLTAPLLPITASKDAPKPAAKPRPAGKDHLHPDPLVDCVVLHAPDSTPTLDVIFVHGLYGSLGNTWRQGDWRSKYKLDPTRTALRDHPNTHCNCYNNKTSEHTHIYSYNSEINDNTYNESDINDTTYNDITFNDITQRLQKKVIPNENSLITEQFYNNTLVNQTEIVDNYETQAKFVEELFRNENNCCDNNGCESKSGFNDKSFVNDNDFKCKLELSECKCGNDCKAGCGCVCDHCYSSCWPKDWIKEDFPGARVISINYTSDPYLWRPLWVKPCKRLRLHERANQMMDQLLALGVGQRPIIWVGHSKGGLFIKQIYCEAYEAYSQTVKDSYEKSCNTAERETKDFNINTLNNLQYYNVNKIKQNSYTMEYENELTNEKINNYDISNDKQAKNDVISNDNRIIREIIVNNDILKRLSNHSRNCSEENDKMNNHNFNDRIDNDSNYNTTNNESEVNDNCIQEMSNDVIRGTSDFNDEQTVNNHKTELIMPSQSDIIAEFSSNCNDSTLNKSSLWSNSAGFMFYSVPHRGSPLADIKTPITTRSIELLEIAKDCSLVLELQARWLAASRQASPVVRSLVETCRTLMSVLWLRIVSVDSADAGIGPLHGVSVDHREICKPTSRNCLLYTELKDVIQNALNKCRCQ